MKFDDLNADGIKDPLEPGLEDWEIILTNSAGGTTSAFTNVDGNYWFTGLLPDTYTVEEVLQPDWIQSAPLTGTYTVTILQSGDTEIDRDFGNYRLVEIHGEKYHDRDGNGNSDVAGVHSPVEQHDPLRWQTFPSGQPHEFPQPLSSLHFLP